MAHPTACREMLGAAIAAAMRTLARRSSPLAAALTLAIAPAGAQDLNQGFAVQPVTVELLPGQSTAVFTLQNQSDQPATFQIRPFVWDQATGDDQLTPTED